MISSLNFLNKLIIQAKLEIVQSKNIQTLKETHIKFLGKKGYIHQQTKNLNKVTQENRPKLGKAINQAKKEIKKLLIKQENILHFKNIKKSLIQEKLDITLPGRILEIGTFHPITYTIERMKFFFHTLGFIMVDGPEIENNYFNFEALNISKNHPARDEHDTFWFNKKYLLRTHTSSIQVRTMINEKITPIKIISCGRVYRKDYDKNHTPMFHQMEGLMIDTTIDFSNLKKLLYDFLYNFFEKNLKIRFRPSYFPFTEPSAEIDVMDQQCNNWLEILGCGMIHPQILHNVDIDPEKFSGFAFGIGVERLTMLLYRINDIRKFFENDLMFLNQFK